MKKRYGVGSLEEEIRKQRDRVEAGDSFTALEMTERVKMDAVETVKGILDSNLFLEMSTLTQPLKEAFGEDNSLYLGEPVNIWLVKVDGHHMYITGNGDTAINEGVTESTVTIGWVK